MTGIEFRNGTTFNDGDFINLRVTTKNQGSYAATEDTYTDIYLSRNTGLDDTDIFLGRCLVSADAQYE